MAEVRHQSRRRFVHCASMPDRNQLQTCAPSVFVRNFNELAYPDITFFFWQIGPSARLSLNQTIVIYASKKMPRFQLTAALQPDMPTATDSL